MAKCQAWTLPSTYKRESQKCSKTAIPAALIAYDGKFWRVCRHHAAVFCRTPENIFVRRERR